MLVVKQFNVKLPETLYTDVRVSAIQQGITLSEITKRAFDAYFAAERYDQARPCVKPASKVLPRK